MDRLAPELRLISRANEQLVEKGPLAAPGRLPRIAPFAVIIVFTFLSTMIGQASDRRAVSALGVVGLAGTVVVMLLPWHRMPRWSQRMIILLPLLLVGGLVRADGGLNSHFLIIMTVPLLWLALYESRRWLTAGLGIMTVLLTAEVVRLPPLNEDFRALMLVGISVILFPSIAHLVAVNRVALTALAKAANVDMLTGLANRRGLDAALHVSRTEPTDGLGMIFIDLNRFKQVNDSCGHDAGDELLLQVGRRLSAVTRPPDVVARIGGDEFVIACNSSRTAVAALADRISGEIGDTPFQLADRVVSISASVGFSHMSHQPDDTSALLNSADHAMYRAKAATEALAATNRTADLDL
jgi:diguanylate cyclase (GGDEF)-like protein